MWLPDQEEQRKERQILKDKQQVRKEKKKKKCSTQDPRMNTSFCEGLPLEWVKNFEVLVSGKTSTL